MDNRIKQIIEKLSANEEGSFYVYDKETIDCKASELVQAFAGYEFLYSIKTNPFADVVKHIFAKGFGADAASAAEVDLATRLGAPVEKIFYSTPGKTRKDIESVLEKCTIIADSYEELKLLDTIAKEKGMHLPVGIRINPDFSMFGEEGMSSKFGIDEETLKENKEVLAGCSALSIVGIHVHLRSQVLDIDVLLRYYRKIFAHAAQCKSELGWKLSFINFGGGLGIAYATGQDKPLDITSLGDKCRQMAREFDELSSTRLLIETGRYLVCEAGSYVTPVVDCKQSRGTKYLVVQNGLNGFMRPALARLLANATSGALSNFSAEPLFTGTDAFDFTIIGRGVDKQLEKVTVVGSLCTGTDILAEGIMLAKAEIGDYLVVSKAGSYAYTLSPLLFSSQAVPKQFLV